MSSLTMGLFLLRLFGEPWPRLATTSPGIIAPAAPPASSPIPPASSPAPPASSPLPPPPSPAPSSGPTVPSPAPPASSPTAPVPSPPSPAPSSGPTVPSAQPASCAGRAPSPAEGADLAPPPDPRLGERPDGRLDPPPARRWRLGPRLLLFPLRALFWAAAFPLGAALRYEDRHHPGERFLSWFTWSGGDRGLRPAFYYATIYQPEFGLRYFDHASLGEDTNLSLTATTFGARYVYAALGLEPTPVSAPFRLTFDAFFDRRADLLYNGLGNHTYSNAPAARYLMNSLEAILGLRLRPLPIITLFGNVSTGLRRFGNGDSLGGDPALESVFDPARIQGFADGTTFVRGTLGARLDLRDHIGRTSGGVLAEVAFDYTYGIDGDRADYPRLRGAVGVPIDLWAHTHVLWLALSAAMAWDGAAPIPFSELPTLGGPDSLRGFRFQDFRDYTSAFVTAEYRWPAAFWLDGALFVDYGGVFGQNFAQFGRRRLQPDVGVALRIFTQREFYLRITLGYGFGEGFNFSISGHGP